MTKLGDSGPKKKFARVS